MRTFMVLMMGLLGCDRIYGSGHEIAETRALEAFDRVEVLAGLRAEISIGPQEVIVRGDDNIVPAVHTTVKHGLLRVEPVRDFEPAWPTRILIRVPSLLAASSLSGSRVELDGVEAEALALTSEAGSELIAWGRINVLAVRQASGGSIDADELIARAVELYGEAGGQAWVYATEEIGGLVESGSEANVYGRPARREVRTASGGTVNYY